MASFIPHHPSRNTRRQWLRWPARVLTLLMVSNGLLTPMAQAAPEGGNVRAGQASISQVGSLTLIQQTSDRAVIDWRGFGTAASETVRFQQPTATSATLNRVTGGQTSLLLGRLEANGQLFLINPHGIVFGKGAQINVGGLVASTANIANEDFMAGHLIFSQPGEPAAAIVNAGNITAAEGGLVALVAPRVRNDGVISARLGRVMLAAGDTFTLDFYGDQLVNLAMSTDRVGQLVDTDGQPVTPQIAQAGTIDAAGGKVVLVTAATGKSVLDEVINLSGVIRADTVARQAGEIVLLGQGGSVNVSGSLAATGSGSGERGGAIDVLGDRIQLTSSATLDVSGQAGGGTLHVGGDWQGGGDTYRARTTEVAAGARLLANAWTFGDGGEVVVWADGHTAYAGAISARGGAAGGNGGRVEVSGKETLNFAGEVDLGAAYGDAGSLLLDPAYYHINSDEASVLNRILRTGASVTLQADIDINVNAMIDGRGRYAGGGLSLLAGNDININNYIVTYNGPVTLNAGGDINIAPGYGVFTGTGNLYATSGNSLRNSGLVSARLLHLTSTGGNVTIDQGISDDTGTVIIDAATDVIINAPVTNLKNGAAFTATAHGGDVTIDAQVDGRGGVAGGAVTLVAANDIVLNESIVTNDAPVLLTATAGTVSAAAGKGLFAGNGAIEVMTGDNYATGLYGTTGPLSLQSTSGALSVVEHLAETVGDITLRGFAGVDVNGNIANIRNGSALTIIADTGDININGRIDAQDNGTITPVAGGAVTLIAGDNVNINETIVSFDGPVQVTATNGTLTFADSVGDGSGNKKIIAGSGPITVTTGSDFSTGTPPPDALVLAAYGDGTRYLFGPGHPDGITQEEVNEAIADQLKPWVTLATTGKLTLISTGGTVSIDAPIPYTTGAIEINGEKVVVNEHLVNAVDQPIAISAGNGGIVVNKAKSSNYSITVNYTNDGVTPTSQVYSADGTAIDARNADLTLTSLGDIDINGYQIASARNLTIDTRGRLLEGGGIHGSRYQPLGTTGYPVHLTLIADLGIGGPGYFGAGQYSDTTAYASQGDIYLSVFLPAKLRITADQGSVYAAGWLGPDNVLVAGTDVDVTKITKAGSLVVNAGQDARFELMEAGFVDVTAGRDALFDATYGGIFNPPAASIWLDGPDGLQVIAGRDIRFLNDSGLSLADDDPTIGSEPPLSLSAGDTVELRRLQTYGSVAIFAGTTILLHNDIGPSITPDPGTPLFTADQGVASLSLITPTTPGSSISMQGARAVGDIVVDTHTLTAAKSIISTGGGASISAVVENITPGAIGSMAEMTRPPIVAPAVSPGPAVKPPTPPAAISALPPGTPGAANVAGIGAPDGGGLFEIFIPEPSRQVGDQESAPARRSAEEDEQILLAGLTVGAPSVTNPLAFDTASGAFLVFAGGRGEAADEERRR